MDAWILLSGLSSGTLISGLLGLLRLDRDAPIAYPSNVAERFCILAFLVLIGLYVIGLVAHRRKLRSGVKSRAQSVLITALLVILFFVTWETAVRLYGSSLSPTTFQPDAYLLWSMKPNLRGSIHEVPSGPMVINTNSLGLREREIPFTKEPGEFRILCIGDSWAWGHGVKEDETFVRVLETMLRERIPGLNARTINGGVPGFSPVQGWHLFKKLASLYNPDLVIVTGFNRFSTRQIGKIREAVAPSSTRGALQALLQNSVVYQCVRKTLSRFAGDPAPPREAFGDLDDEAAGEVRDQTQEFFGKIDDEIASRGARGLFFDHLNSLKPEPPFEIARSSRSSSPPFEFVLSARRTSLEMMRLASIYNVELHTPLRATKDFWIENDPTQHPGPAGHREIASCLFKALEDLGLIPDKSRSGNPSP